VHILHEEILDLAQDKVVITGFGSIPPKTGRSAHGGIKTMK
jgi:hypothetical protein